MHNISFEQKTNDYIKQNLILMRDHIIKKTLEKVLNEQIQDKLFSDLITYHFNNKKKFFKSWHNFVTC